MPSFHTLQKSGIISMPSERTLRDYRHFNASTSGFSRDTDLQLLDLVKQEKSEYLAKYVALVIDEIYIKEFYYITNILVLLLDLKI